MSGTKRSSLRICQTIKRLLNRFLKKSARFVKEVFFQYCHFQESAWVCTLGGWSGLVSSGQLTQADRGLGQAADYSADMTPV